MCAVVLLFALHPLSAQAQQTCYGPSDCVSPAVGTDGICEVPAQEVKEVEPIAPPVPEPTPAPVPVPAPPTTPPSVPVSAPESLEEEEPDEVVDTEEEQEEVEIEAEEVEEIADPENNEETPDEESEGLMTQFLSFTAETIDSLLFSPLESMWCWLTGCEE